MTYLVTVVACIALLVVIPIWTHDPGKGAFPWIMVVVLAGLAVVVPMLFRGGGDGEA